ncbi:uncharacterized protein Z519_03933 [Cladophialophora bantiana CBS 173.52]|uniref:Unplaced genomic scaffold supercont1.5, whole genome shotgun sequence n=1 Tax=Cladophialophora bantiana (strain ATCC 10958 / CBS 173.52 / CDC B-1940 / NIH 8579) TaxID=1442370 RepID=A0A0D2IEZ2_CLAB1|nr:uncharacterized protein Z519_03933 [Cladophialophora bantiana CBS 173.52]KIW95349.1 hypothetical protein Z519_03933 [Cladophialophora bantiana CBS 173.52]
MGREIDQEWIRFSITADKTGSIFWRADFAHAASPNDETDTAEVTGIPLHQRRQPLEIEDATRISNFERSWRTLTLLAEEWGWLNGSGQY